MVSGAAVAPIFEADGITVYAADCRAVLPALEAVDHVLTDPPYSPWVHGRSVAGGGARGGRARALGFEPLAPELRAAVALECGRLARRWVLVFSDLESGHLWRSDLEAGGLEYIRPGLWVKEGCTPQVTGDRPAIGAELITVAHRPGRKRWNGGGRPAVWSVPTAHRGADVVTHTTQKPEALIRRLLLDFTDPGDLVLDPFGGSGTTAAECKRLGRRCVVVERDPGMAAGIVQRLEGVDLDERLVKVRAPRGRQSALRFA